MCGVIFSGTKLLKMHPFANSKVANAFSFTIICNLFATSCKRRTKTKEIHIEFMNGESERERER